MCDVLTIKSRSTGLSGNLTSPTSEFVASGGQAESTTSTSVHSASSSTTGNNGSVTSSNIAEPTTQAKIDDIPKTGGSILGLRASKFSSSNIDNPPNITIGKLPDINPRITSSSANSTSNSFTGNIPKVAPATSSAEENVNTTPTLGIGLRPKPLPKPRPWSIVGVDRKSGEVTSVSGGASSSPPSSKLSTEAVKHNSEQKIGGNGIDKEKVHGISKFEKKPEPMRRKSSGTGNTAASSNRSSVRDMINNMNKGQTQSNPVSERKGSSLPRGVQPQATASSSGSIHSNSTVSDVTRKFASESQKGGSSSPGSNKKITSTDKVSLEKRESTCKDDPRILKLDDDFDVLEV